MKKRILHLLGFFALFVVLSARANELAVAKSIYDVDMYEDLPYLQDFIKEYESENSDFDYRYQFRWNMPQTFDKGFGKIIKNFGTNEIRINNATEDRLLAELQRMPKEFYPYLGPNLHNVPGLSGKILDLPGIKETKHRFPQRIASVFKDVEYIEYLSPALYIFLMPEIWGENLESLERPKLKKQNNFHVNARVSKKLIMQAERKVLLSEYKGKNPNATAKQGMRNYTANKDTPLSGADVQAFALSLDGLNKLNKEQNFDFQMITLIPLVTYLDEKNGVDKNVSFLRTVVNPCQSIIKKIKWLGKYSQFQAAISEQGFGLEDWAYTCDKTIKAYRVATMSPKVSTAIKILRTGYIYRLMEPYNFTPEEKQEFRYFIDASIALYDTKPEDVEAVKKNLSLLKRKLPKSGTSYFGSPIIYNP